MIVLQRGLMRYSLGGVLLALACGGAPEAIEPSASAMPTPRDFIIAAMRSRTSGA